jgi:glutathione S-transferase
VIALYGHPFSSYTWKAEIALIEKGADYRFRILDDDQPEHWEELRAVWPVGQFPLLKNGDATLFEASVIVEYIDRLYQGTPHLIPADADAALAVRLLDRVFDNHFQARFQAVVSEYLPFITATPDPARVARAREALEKVYGWLDPRLGAHDWATPHGFTLADCAAAPALFYADWVHPIDARYANLKAYRVRLLARPSVVQCVEAARPYRAFFPLGAPDRD